MRAEAAAKPGGVSIDIDFIARSNVPLAGSLSVFARAGKPHGVVSHVFVRGFYVQII
jgi:hypothetical protein